MKKTTQFFKRGLDIASATIGLVVLSPVWILVGLVILFDDGRPFLFSQVRVGKNGRQFRLLKFRTMIRDADKHSRLTPTEDARIIRPGKILRDYNLDEIPQLWNILRGDMSVVGPRPEVPEFVDLKDVRWQKTLAVRPGLTYPGTLYFRRQGDILKGQEDYVKYYREKVLPIKLEYAQRYYEEATFAGDIKIIFLTIGDIIMPGHRSIQALPDLKSKSEGSKKTSTFESKDGSTKRNWK